MNQNALMTNAIAMNRHNPVAIHCHCAPCSDPPGHGRILGEAGRRWRMRPATFATARYASG